MIFVFSFHRQNKTMHIAVFFLFFFSTRTQYMLAIVNAKFPGPATMTAAVFCKTPKVGLSEFYSCTLTEGCKSVGRLTLHNKGRFSLHRNHTTNGISVALHLTGNATENCCTNAIISAANLKWPKQNEVLAFPHQLTRMFPRIHIFDVNRFASALRAKQP